ncbi:MAG: response regulator [Chloroflexota bacterium]
MGGYDVLVVNQDEALRGLLKVLLEEIPHVRTVLAEDHAQALSLAREVDPDLVLIDSALSHPSCFRLVTELRGDPTTQAVPIILLTAISGVRERALAAGCDACIEEPFDIDHFTGLVRQHLESYSARRQHDYAGFIK